MNDINMMKNLFSNISRKHGNRNLNRAAHEIARRALKGGKSNFGFEKGQNAFLTW